MYDSKKLIGVLIDLSNRLKYGWNRNIHAAARKGNLNKVKFILAKEPELADAKNSTGEIALCLAASEGRTKMVELLIFAGAGVYVKGYDGETALHKAANGGHTEAVELLLAGGADVNARSNKGHTALHRAAGGRKEVVEVLLASGTDVNAKSKKGHTAPMELR
ncbi:MAG: ankyrin repeat domain-containing protein [Planctomycetota bacterium]|jgi:ankyrin repeat protein